jgi:CRISPR-associated protein (Cas_Cas2CT1978)
LQPLGACVSLALGTVPIAAEVVRDGSVVMAYASSNESGYEFWTLGPNRRLPVEFDGLFLVAFHPPEKQDL